MPKKKKKEKGDAFSIIKVGSACGHKVNSQGNCSFRTCWNNIANKYKGQS